MNTKNLKAYAPKARRQFIEAVKKRAAYLGIYQHKVEPVQFGGEAALIEGRVFSRKQGEQRQQLEKRVAAKGYELFLREMAYTWFNRFAALRYMEIHEYLDHGFRVLSHPTNPDGLPEILGHASDVADSLELDKSHIIELQLAGDKEEELYRELLLGQCHHLYKIMPFMFEQLDDATELLLPDNLTKTDSILKDLVNDIPEEDWSQIEVIGWLYQFYISEHKDAVIGKVVKSEDIPAATQLFTPNWIVKYLVQNSVGRQWLATYPESELKGKMEYYIEPAEQTPEVIEQLKAIVPTSIDPEQIKVLDPAAGSGHILVEVYEVLREIYLERGYRLREIPELILTKNIYGLDIDDRAAQLAGFALMMKAREDDRRIFQRVQAGGVYLNVYSLQSSEGLDIDKLWAGLDLEGKQQTGTSGGLFDEPTDVIPAQIGIYSDYLQLLNYLKTSFLQAKTLGSLIQIEQNKLALLQKLQQILTEKVQGVDPAAKYAAVALLSIVNQSVVLAQQYDAVIANPPYIGSKGMNAELKYFAKNQFPNSKSDLFAMFMERAFGLLHENGYNAQVNMQSWMFLSSYEALREWLLETKTIVTMAHLGARAFGQISGEVVQTTAWVLSNAHISSLQPVFFRLIDGGENEKRHVLLNNEKRFDQIRQRDFKLVPGSPIAYWVDESLTNVYKDNKTFANVAPFKSGMSTTNNERFLRFWHEVDYLKLNFSASSLEEARVSKRKWFPYKKGGSYRKWAGNDEYVVNWFNDGTEIKSAVVNNPSDPNTTHWSRRIFGVPYFFKPSLTYSRISSSDFSVRYSAGGTIFSDASNGCFPEEDRFKLLAFLNSTIAKELLKLLCPTINFMAGDVQKLPSPLNTNWTEQEESLVESCIEISQADWSSQETSWCFSIKSIVHPKLSNHINHYIKEWSHKQQILLESEKKLDEIFFNAFDVDSSRFANKRYADYLINEANDIEAIELKNIISTAIGCMMGRYSLDREGLIYAHAGNEGFKELVADGAYVTFLADDDGIIPLASEDWLFDDDATTRFREFVKIVWGDEHLNENLEFVADSLCLHALKPKKGEGAMDTIRRYFSTQFFKDHCKTYKKRPIYWLFSSGKEKAFECLVYLHRYNEGTLSRMRTEYVTPLMGKYDHQHSSLEQEILEGSTEQTRLAEKALKDLEKKQAELRTFDEQLKHHAEKRITLDLDDGVKVNYGKFGNLLADVKNIHGKAVK
jgi:type II restriction/modification system DNA methylase subunit YeeA